MNDTIENFERVCKQILHEFPDPLGSEEDVEVAMRLIEDQQESKKRSLTRRLKITSSLTLILGGLLILSVATVLLVMFGLAFVSPFLLQVHNLNLYEHYVTLGLDVWLSSTTLLFGISFYLLHNWKRTRKWQEELDQLQWEFLHARHEPKLQAGIHEALRPKSGYRLYLSEQTRIYGTKYIRVLIVAWVLYSTGGPNVKERMDKEFLMKRV
jgi:hypothetical protein